MELPVTKSEFYQDSLLFHGNVRNVMGTKMDFILVGKKEDESRVLWEETVSILKKINSIANRFDRDSELSMINSSEPMSKVVLSDTMHDMLGLAYRYYLDTDHIFDITLGRCDFPELDDDGFLTTGSQACFLDLGGFAKGFALQRITEMLVANNVSCAYIDLGNSSIMGIGSHPHGDGWQISIPDPFTGKEIKRISLRDSALSISGNTPQYNTHIVNTSVREFESHQKISAVITGMPLDCEVLSTTWMIADESQRSAIAGRFNIIDEFVYTV